MKSISDINLYYKRKWERAMRLRFLFKHRPIYGRGIQILWPDQPDMQNANMFNQLYSRKWHDPVKPNEADVDWELRKRFHRTLAEAQLEGDFDMFGSDPQQIAMRVVEYGLNEGSPRWLKDRPWLQS